MGRILAIDYGAKRVGLAVTDPMKIIATSLDTVPEKGAIAYLKEYISNQPVEKIIIGDPKNLDNTPAGPSKMVGQFIQKLKNAFPRMPVEKVDERFTSKMAAQALVMSGMKKKNRQKKGNLDKMSATIILQTYLESNKSI